MALASWSKPGISAPGQPTNHGSGTKSSKSNMRHQFPSTDLHKLHSPEEHRNRHKVELRKSFPRATQEASSPPWLQYARIRIAQNQACSCIIMILQVLQINRLRGRQTQSVNFFDRVEGGQRGNVERNLFSRDRSLCAWLYVWFGAPNFYGYFMKFKLARRNPEEGTSTSVPTFIPLPNLCHPSFTKPSPVNLTRERKETV